MTLSLILLGPMIMDNAMTNKDRAEQIAEKVLDLEERLTLWKSLAIQKLGKPIEVAESAFERRLGEIRSASKDREHHAEFLKAIHASSDDSVLMTTLYEGIHRRATVH
ncbi:MAG: hypothetical protein ACLQMO_07505 [Acidobacteriaceae bacterium]